MQSIDLDAFDRAFDAVVKGDEKLKALKRKFLEQAGREIQGDVVRNIAGSGMKNGGGPLAAWQTYTVGSKGGYVAVRAVKDATGANSPGAITNYTENGHKIRRPSGTAKVKRRSRAEVPAVRGYHYYRAARDNAEPLAQRLAGELRDALAREMGGSA